MNKKPYFWIGLFALMMSTVMLVLGTELISEDWQWLYKITLPISGFGLGICFACLKDWTDGK